MKLALAGDTMLGRTVAERLAVVQPTALFAEEVVAAAHEADLVIVNLECAISDRGERWPDPSKPFFFRAPPVAVEALQHLGVGCVTLANNHALDFGADALLDTLRHLADAGIAHVGAGIDEAAARAPATFSGDGVKIAVIGVTDHPDDYAAGPARPGVAYADLRRGPPDWLLDTIRHVATDIVVVSPHWGPNMVDAPVEHVRAAAAAFRAAGATLVAGHSAHVFHGVADRVIYDLGDLIDDYARDPSLHNELGLLFLVTFDGCAPTRLEALPLALDHCHTRLADAGEAAWISERFRRACAILGTDVTERAGRLVIEWDACEPIDARCRSRVAESKDVEISLDQILRERFVDEAEDAGEEDGVERPLVPSDENEVAPPHTNEFVCRSCFLVSTAAGLLTARGGFARTAPTTPCEASHQGETPWVQ